MATIDPILDLLRLPNFTFRLKSWKGDYLHRPDSAQGVTTWHTGIGNEWSVEFTGDKLMLRSWRGDYLHRPDSAQGVTTWSTGVGNQWTAEVEAGALKLRSWKGDYLHRPDAPQGVTTWHTGVGNQWTVELGAYRPIGTQSTPEVFFKSKLNGHVIDIHGADRSPGAALISWQQKETGSENQRWSLVDAGGGYFHIRSRLHGQVIDIAGADRNPGARVVSWPQNSPPTDNQLWTLVPAGNGCFYIQSKLHGFVLDIRGGDPANGVDLIAWPKNSPPSDNQLWMFADALPVAPEQPTAIVNGSFEQFARDAAGTMHISLGPGQTELVGWTIGGAGIVYAGTQWKHAHGNYSVDLNHVAPGSIEQTLRTTPGVTYKVAWAMAGNPGTPQNRGSAPLTKTMTVTATPGGTEANYTFSTANTTATNMGWIEKWYTFTATATATVLRFASTTPNTCGPVIDNVQIVRFR